jgi:RNA recognition motif-containing protein
MGTKLFVRNLSPDTTENEVYDLFAGVGRVKSILLPINRITGQNKNQCIVDMDTVELARRAVQKVNGAVLHGLTLEVSVNRPPDLRSSPV